MRETVELYQRRMLIENSDKNSIVYSRELSYIFCDSAVKLQMEVYTLALLVNRKPQKLKKARSDGSTTRGNQKAFAQEWLRSSEMPTWLLKN